MRKSDNYKQYNHDIMADTNQAKKTLPTCCSGFLNHQAYFAKFAAPWFYLSFSSRFESIGFPLKAMVGS